MDKVLLWLQEKTMDSIPKRMEVQVLENLPEQEDFYHTLRYFGVFRGFFYKVCYENQRLTDFKAKTI